MEVYSIGFTKKTAAQFFEILKKENIRRLVDVRLNNVSQAGFAAISLEHDVMAM